MEKSTLERANEILKDIKNFESILYYADIYKKQNEQNNFSFTHFDEVSNERKIKIDSKYNDAFLIYVKLEIEKLETEFKKL